MRYRSLHRSLGGMGPHQNAAGRFISLPAFMVIVAQLARAPYCG